MINTEIKDKNIKERIRIIIKERGTSISNFAKQVGVSPTYLVSLLNGDDKGISSMILKCLSKNGININWLLNGKGEMYIKNEESFKKLRTSLQIAQKKILQLENDLEKTNYLAVELKKMIMEGK